MVAIRSGREEARVRILRIGRTLRLQWREGRIGGYAGTLGVMVQVGPRIEGLRLIDWRAILKWRVSVPVCRSTAVGRPGSLE